MLKLPLFKMQENKKLARGEKGAVYPSFEVLYNTIAEFYSPEYIRDEGGLACDTMYFSNANCEMLAKTIKKEYNSDLDFEVRGSTITFF